MNRRKLLIADDSELNRAILANMLESDFDIIEVTGGKEAIFALQSYRSDISAFLLDIVMPDMNGFEVLEEMRRLDLLRDIPTIMISAETGSAYIDRAFQLGASDYINRPFVPGIIRHRIINTILMHTKKEQLMNVVSGWFYRQETNSELMVSILEYAVGFRSGESGTHMSGVGALTKLLVKRLTEKTDKYRINLSDLDTISMAASLHDIGKLLIPREILEKPSRLTDAEFEIVKHHTQLGAQIISDLPTHKSAAFTNYAVTICRWHHERWNGEGYPDGLVGDNIPIVAQITAIADAYDALTSKRCYKEAFSHDRAMAMIHAGECGSFNPLLVECLDDIADSIRSGKSEYGAENGKTVVQHAVDELYSGKDIFALRMTKQIEESDRKKDFMASLCDELWFEYTSDPESIHLSKGAAEHMGLPAVIDNPLSTPQLTAVIGKETAELIREKVDTLSSDESYIEIAADVVLDGKRSRCQIAMLVLRSADDDEKCTALLGRIIDISENYRRLERYNRASSDQATEQVLLPVTAGADDVLHITHDQVGRVLQGYRKMFETVRLVDPGICMQISTDSTGYHSIEKSEHCYSIWGKIHRCENCISQEVIRTHKTHSKVEAIGNDVYYVLAMCVEIDRVPYSLECVNPIRSVGMSESSGESIINQLLVRNRQVYIDSMTKIYNRRYYDERVHNLTGEQAVAMIDIDDFKQINDKFGHPAGDVALYRIAQTIRFTLRRNDLLIRYGGDEFFLMLNGMPEHSLQRKLDDVCRSVASMELPEYPGLTLSVSIGAVYASGRVSDLVRRADVALYRAKIEKNRAVIFDADEESNR